MQDERARELLAQKRTEVEQMLADAQTATGEDVDARPEAADSADDVPPIAAEQIDDAIAASLRDRLAAIERAEARIADGTYGRSVRSGDPIPDERLEIDPTAELTVEEAAASE